MGGNTGGSGSSGRSSGSGGTWGGSQPPIVLEDLLIIGFLNPCSLSVMNMIQSSNKIKDITDMVKVFRNDANNSFKISEERLTNEQGGTPNMTTDAITKYNSITNTYEVKLNTNVMENASKEYIAVTIIHEIIHAYLSAYWGIVRNNDTQHPLMVEYYCIDFMADALVALFPNLSQNNKEDALALAWYGFDMTPSWDNFTILQKLAMQNINDAYKNHTHGTPCQ